MTHSLLLEVPEEVYLPLAKTAEAAGQKVEQLAVELLAAAARPVADDPVENFIGSLHSDVPDWADAHDKYIGQSLRLEMQEGNEG